jgi:hypothetical protein
VSTFPVGSEWRKWDLQVHTPGTALNDQFDQEGEEDKLDTFARLIQESDVDAIGVTDYWVLSQALAAIKRFHELYPDSDKLLLPCVELRLIDTVNRENEHVNVSLVFRPDVTEAQAARFAESLKTEKTVEGGRHLSAAEIVDAGASELVVVSRKAVEEALAATFGPKTLPLDNVIVLSSTIGDGMRAERGAQRKEHLADEIDKMSDGFLGRADNVDWYLRTDRAEDQTIFTPPRPVFATSDSHSFIDMRERMGKTITTGSRHCATTWVKADPTFAGLQQVFIEPRDRIRIQATRPDVKMPYQIIRRIKFSNTTDFPERIDLNENLVSIIGSRSSGKSALLAYAAHAVDPVYTVRQQRDAGMVEPGPAAGRSWNDVTDIHCEVEWGDGHTDSGHVIYIPQNSLFALSNRPDDITAKIRPALYRVQPDTHVLVDRLTNDLEQLNDDIRTNVLAWFDAGDKLIELRRRQTALGERVAVESAIASLTSQVADIRETANLSAEDAQAYEDFVDRVGRRRVELQRLAETRSHLATWATSDPSGATVPAGNVHVTVATTPRLVDLPETIRDGLQAKLDAAAEALRREIEEAIIAEIRRLAERSGVLEGEIAQDEIANADLVARSSANDALQEALGVLQDQRSVLAGITEAEAERTRLQALRDEAASNLQTMVVDRAQVIERFTAAFSSLDTSLGSMRFGVETGFTDGAIGAVSQPIDFRSSEEFVVREDNEIRLDLARQDPQAFLHSLGGVLRLKSGRGPAEFAVGVLTLTEEVRLFAELQEDRIGGFKPATMTPGKQALFALSLLLTEDDIGWPLLIDQPEDDLDSRSIYDEIVPYLKERKSSRQILMVSHNANLVVGADSEQVIVANRHGEDRRNRDDQMFEYATGSLECSQPAQDSPFVLDTCGIQEHACELLDGGQEAFKKRRDKYRI